MALNPGSGPFRKIKFLVLSIRKTFAFTQRGSGPGPLRPRLGGLEAMSEGWWLSGALGCFNMLQTCYTNGLREFHPAFYGESASLRSTLRLHDRPSSCTSKPCPHHVGLGRLEFSNAVLIPSLLVTARWSACRWHCWWLECPSCHKRSSMRSSVMVGGFKMFQAFPNLGHFGIVFPKRACFI